VLVIVRDWGDTNPHLSEWPKLNIVTVLNTVKDVERQHHTLIFGGGVNDTATVANSSIVSLSN
jgi:hypothetical protein